ncbi:hypothetical protein EJ110_NYTH55027 [Nymphaea thermarum]|nr:hypothetical protein EJ110_NYTH55027 [Nymphaea thermarum]
MADSSSSSTVHTNVPDVGSTRTDHVPVQVTTIQLNKENYSRWSAAITMGILGRGRIAYVNGRKVEHVEGSMAWDTWFLEDNQVKAWIVNSVSSDIQPLILRKKTARDMWVILEHMYGQKKRKVRVYQLMRDVYSLRQGTRSVADFYAALKSKWEDLDYHSDLTWKCPQDQLQYVTKEWENRVFLFLSGLNDDFENIRSQILNSDESFSIEDVYARVEAEEQRKLVTSDRKGEEQSAFVSRASAGSSRSSHKCTHCKKLGHTVDFCWDLHPEKKNGRGKPSSSKQPVSSATDHGDRKASFFAEQLRELRAYLSQVDEETPHVQVLDKDEEGISIEAHEQEKKEEEVSPMVTEQEAREMLKIYPPPPSNFLIFTLFEELPKGDYVMEELANELKQMTEIGLCSVTSLLKSLNLVHPKVVDMNLGEVLVCSAYAHNPQGCFRQPPRFECRNLLIYTNPSPLCPEEFRICPMVCEGHQG